METTRSDIRNKLKEEFDILHDLMRDKELSVDQISLLVQAQLGLAGQIIREERALNGDIGTYALPPYMPVK